MEETLSKFRLEYIEKNWSNWNRERQHQREFSWPNANMRAYHRNMLLPERNGEPAGEFSELFLMMEDELKIKLNPRAINWYPKKGYLGWHTNADVIGFRYYLTWCENSQDSYFRYRDPETNEIITHWDSQGWQLSKFRVLPDLQNKSKFKSGPGVMWHCVGSYTNRVSIGFRDVSIGSPEEMMTPFFEK
jgi:hypothetical protein